MENTEECRKHQGNPKNNYISKPATNRESCHLCTRTKGTSLALRGCIWKADDGATSNAAGQHHSALLLVLVCKHNTREINLKTLQQCLGTQAPAGHSCTLQHKLQLEVWQQARRVWLPAKKQGNLGLHRPFSIVSSARRKRVGVFMHLPLWGGKMVNY